MKAGGEQDDKAAAASAAPSTTDAAASTAAASPASSAAADSSATATAASADSKGASTAAASSTDEHSKADDDDAGSASTSAHVEEIIEKDLAAAVAAKGRGNQFFARQQYPQAIDEYSRAIALCPAGESASAEEKEALSVFFSNRAAAFLMQNLYGETVSDCTNSLALHASNPKALGRRARAHEALDQLAEAVEDLKALVAIDPRDKDSARSLARVEKALNEKNEKLKTEMMDKLKGFGNVSGTPSAGAAGWTACDSPCACDLLLYECLHLLKSSLVCVCVCLPLPDDLGQVRHEPGQLQGHAGPVHRQLQHLVRKVSKHTHADRDSKTTARARVLLRAHQQRLAPLAAHGFIPCHTRSLPLFTSSSNHCSHFGHLGSLSA